MSVFYSHCKKWTMEILEQFCQANPVQWVVFWLSTSVAESDKVPSSRRWSEDVRVRIAVNHLQTGPPIIMWKLSRGQPTAPNMLTVKVQGDGIPVTLPRGPIEENTRSFHGQILWLYALEVNKMNPIRQLAVSSLFSMNVSLRWTSSNTFGSNETSSQQ